jgi:hypothetical protein
MKQSADEIGKLDAIGYMMKTLALEGMCFAPES